MLRLLVIPLICLVCQSHAHESPSHSLEQINKHIKEKSTPALLFQRAMTYKALGKMELAAADLSIATQAQPNELDWQLELSQIELAIHKPNNALMIANRALKLAKNRNQRADIHFLRAQAYQLSGKPKPSLHACQLAFKQIPQGKMEWFLLRAENQRLLGQHQHQLLGLKAGLKKLPNTILKPHYVDALIDAGKHSEALTVIEKELPTLRWKSHWQIKQARALIGLKREAEAKEHLSAAQQEIKARLNPAHPDIFLLADQAHIYFISGDMAAAKANLIRLKKHRAPAWITSRLDALTLKK